MMNPIDYLIEHHNKQTTGTLSMHAAGQERKITFKRGLVTYIDSNVREEALGQMLLAQGRLTEEQLKSVLDQMLATKALQGDVLISMGLLDPMQVFESLNQQMHLKLKNCIAMQEPTVMLTDEIEHQNPDFKVPLYRCILDGLMQYYSPDRYKREASYTREAILKFTAVAKPNLDKLQLNTEESKLLRLIDGKSSMGDFVTAAHNKRLAAALVFFLNKIGYLLVDSSAVTHNAPDKFFDTTEGTLPKTASEAKPPPPTSDNTEKSNVSEMYALLLKLKSMNYYQILNVQKDAPSAQIERAYNLICKQHHLGQIEQYYKGEDAENAKQLLDTFTLAYTVLSDNKHQQAYNAALAKPSSAEPKPVDVKLKAEVEILKAEMQLRFGNPKAALDYAESAIKLDPEQADYHVTLAQVQSKLDLLESDKPSKKVEEQLRKALELKSSSWKAFFELAQYYKIHGLVDKALNCFRNALEHNSKCHAAEVEIRLLEKRAEKSKSTPLFASFRKKG